MVGGLADVPALVGVDGDADAVTDGGTGGAQPPDVVVQVAADLELDLGEAAGDGFLGRPGELLGTQGPRGGNCRAQSAFSGAGRRLG